MQLLARGGPARTSSPSTAWSNGAKGAADAVVGQVLLDELEGQKTSAALAVEPAHERPHQLFGRVVRGQEVRQPRHVGVVGGDERQRAVPWRSGRPSGRPARPWRHGPPRSSLIFAPAQELQDRGRCASGTRRRPANASVCTGTNVSRHGALRRWRTAVDQGERPAALLGVAGAAPAGRWRRR